MCNARTLQKEAGRLACLLGRIEEGTVSFQAGVFKSFFEPFFSNKLEPLTPTVYVFFDRTSATVDLRQDFQKLNLDAIATTRRATSVYNKTHENP
jgi:hypothetical protein